MTTNTSRSPRGHIVRALIIGAAFLAASRTIRLLTPEYLSSDITQRVLGVMIGTIALIYANAVPKTLSPLIQMRCDPVVEQATRRFTGWTLSLGALAYVVTWMIAPLPIANALSASLLAITLLIVVARLLFTMTRRARS
ncbi:MAG: hypothetical protein ABJE10_24560 [bacterium]